MRSRLVIGFKYVGFLAIDISLLKDFALIVKTELLCRFTKMKLFFLLISIFFGSSAFTQNEKDTVNASTFSPELLESLIFEEVNRIRLENDLAELIQVDSLSEQVDYHAINMADGRKVFDSDSTSDMIECNAKIFFRNSNPSLTYLELAENIASQWLNSPEESQLILGASFLYGGCGVTYEEWKSISEIYIYSCFRISR